MPERKQDVYLTCTKLKGHKKKHIDVCRKCRWNASCKAYQGYCQLPLPLANNLREENQPPLSLGLVKDPSSAEDIKVVLAEIISELKKIRDLCS